MRQSMFAEPIPETALVVGTLKFHSYESGTACYVKAWRGRQTRPYAHYRFRDDARRAEWIAGQCQAEDAGQQAKSDRKTADQAARAKLVESIQVGTLLHYAWGWEQTQCEFFQVIEKRGSVVVLMPIGGEEVEGSNTGGMACMLRPVPDKFYGVPARKVICSHGVPMKHGTATITTADQQHYCSWYA